MPNEFNLIDRYFRDKQPQRKDVLLAIGDDCALLQPPEHASIAVSTDTLVVGTHFLPDANPAWLAHKALASNISDLVAMGATPAWVSLALTIPDIDEPWLREFSQAFFKLADYFGVQLVGGDTTKGPLSISITVQGFVDANRALRRDAAKVGDWVYVTGDLGDSKAGLDVILQPKLRDKPFATELEQRHYFSTPRVLAGQALLNLANAAIDISDGLIADLCHILKRSGVGASIDVGTLPISKELLSFVGDLTTAKQYALTSGEEYELCFTVPEANKGSLESALAHTGTKVTCIGQIRSGDKLDLHNRDQPLDWQLAGFDHFEDK